MIGSPLSGRRQSGCGGTTGRTVRNGVRGSDSCSTGGARSEWLALLCWERIARLLSGLNPAPFELGICRTQQVSVANPGRYEQMYGSMPILPDNKSRLWGVNSFA